MLLWRAFLPVFGPSRRLDAERSWPAAVCKHPTDDSVNRGPVKHIAGETYRRSGRISYCNSAVFVAGCGGVDNMNVALHVVYDAQ